jgi:hypothetical protein
MVFSEVVQMATAIAVGEARVSSSSGNPSVYTYDSTGGAADKGFNYVVFGTNLAP